MIAKIDILALDHFINSNYNWTKVGPITIGDNSKYYKGDNGKAYLFLKVIDKHSLDLCANYDENRIYLNFKYPNSFFIQYDEYGNCEIRNLRTKQNTIVAECNNVDILIELYCKLIEKIYDFTEFIKDEDYKTELDKIINEYGCVI